MYILHVIKNKFCDLITISEEKPSLVKYLKAKYKNINIENDYKKIINDKSIKVVIVCVPRQPNELWKKIT